MTGIRVAMLGLLLTVLAPPIVGAARSDPAVRLDPRRAIEASRSAIGRPVGAHVLTDTRGVSFSLAAYRGKPLVLSLVYSACNTFCPITTQHLIDAVAEARRAFGPDRFEVLTVGFDARNDTPARMAQFAANQRIDPAHWRVASAEAATLRALLGEVGFSYVEIAGGLDHVAQTTIIDRDGLVFRQVYGDDFPLRMFMEPLRDAVLGTAISLSVTAILDRIKFICTTFDPGAGRYRIDYGLVFGSSLAALSLLIMGSLILREWLRNRRA
jgi:protein SCO1/2